MYYFILEILMEDKKNNIFGDDESDTFDKTNIDRQFAKKMQRKSHPSSGAPTRYNSRQSGDDDFNIFNSRPVRGKEDLDGEINHIDPAESQSNIMKQLRKNQYDRYSKTEDEDTK